MNSGCRAGGSFGRAVPLAVAVVLLAAACGGNKAQTSAAVEESTTTAPTVSDENVEMGGELTVGVEAIPESLDPLAGNGGATVSAAALAHDAIFDALLAPNLEGDKTAPQLAKSVEPNEDFSQWTAVLRTGIQFHDGTPLDAAAVALNYNYRAVPENCRCAPSYAGITATAVDATTVRFDLADPDAHFASKRLVDEIVSPSSLVPGADRDRNPIGTGPFKLVDRDQLRFERNEQYWRTDDRDRPLPYLDGFRISSISDPTVRLASLQRGEVDLMEIFDGPTLKSASDDSSLTTVRSGNSGATAVIANLRRPNAQIVEVRQALSLAVDREALAQSYVQSANEPAYSFFSEDSGIGVESSFPKRDLPEAKRLVEKVKAEHGADALKMKIVCAKLPEAESLLPVALNQIKEAGFDAELAFLDIGEYAAQVLAGGTADWDIACTRTPSFDADPSTLGPFLRTGQAANVAGYSNPEVDALFEEDRTTVDPEARRAIYQKISDAVVRDLPYVPLLFTRSGVSSSATAQGVVRIDPYWPTKVESELLWRKAS